MSIFPTRLLLAIDSSEDAELATDTALELARATNSELHVVYVGQIYYVGMDARVRVNPAGVPTVQMEQEAQKKFDVELEKISDAGGSVAEAHLRMGAAAEEILELAEEMDAGLIVLGSRGLGGIRRALMGSVSHSVVRHAHCPVMVVRPLGQEGSSFVEGTILASTDGSHEADLAVRTAADIAGSVGSELHLVHVLPVSRLYSNVDIALAQGIKQHHKESRQEAEKLLEEQASKAKDGGTEVAEAHLVEGEPAAEIVALAEDIGAGLIVMGSRGLGGIRRALIGSISDAVVRHAHCPVIVARE